MDEVLAWMESQGERVSWADVAVICEEHEVDACSARVDAAIKRAGWRYLPEDRGWWVWRGKG